MPKRDFSIVKRNVLKLRNSNVPDTEIDQYLNEEGWQPEEFIQAHQTSQKPNPNLLPSDIKIGGKTPEVQYEEITKNQIADTAARQQAEEAEYQNAVKKQQESKKIGGTGNVLREPMWMEKGVPGYLLDKAQQVGNFIAPFESVKRITAPFNVVRGGGIPSDVDLTEAFRESTKPETVGQDIATAGLMVAGGKIGGKVIGGILKGNPALAQTVKEFTPDIKGIADWIKNKKVKIPVTEDDLKSVINDYGAETGNTIDPVVVDFIKNHPNKGDLFRKAAKGESITIDKTVPRFGGPKTPKTSPLEPTTARSKAPTDIIPFGENAPIKAQSGAVSRPYSGPMPADVPMYDKLAKLDALRNMDTPSLEKLIDRSYENNAPQSILNKLETIYSERVSEAEQNITEGINLDELIIPAYKSYIGESPLASFVSKANALENMKSNLIDAMQGKKITDKQALSIAKDIYDRKKLLIERYKKTGIQQDMGAGYDAPINRIYDKENIIDKDPNHNAEVDAMIAKHFGQADVEKMVELWNNVSAKNNPDMTWNIRQATQKDIADRGWELDSSEIHDRFINKLPQDVIDDVTVQDILAAYKHGSLPPGSLQQGYSKTAKNISSVPVSNEKLLGAPQSVPIDNPKEIYSQAIERSTKANAESVLSARKKLFLQYNSDPNLHEKIGIKKTELTKKIRTLTGATATSVSKESSLNAGVPDEFKWTGISNVSYINKASIGPKDIDKYFKKIKVPVSGNEWFAGQGNALRHYILDSILAIDTRISYKDLSFDIKTLERALGTFHPREVTIEINTDSRYTVAHEIGHYLDFKWAREIGMGHNGLSEGSYNFPHIQQVHKLSDEHIAWAKEYLKFVDGLKQNGAIDSEYHARATETFARFVSQFCEWTQKQAGRYSEKPWSAVSENFTEKDFTDFIDLLQKKSYIDAKYNIKPILDKSDTDSVQRDQVPGDISKGELTPDWVRRSNIPENLKELAKELQAKEGELQARNNIRLAIKAGSLFVDKPIDQLSPVLKERVANIAKALGEEINLAERPHLIKNEEIYKADTYFRTRSGMPEWAQDLQQSLNTSYKSIVESFQQVANGKDPGGFLGKAVKREIFDRLIIATDPITGQRHTDAETIKLLSESNIRLTSDVRADLRKLLDEDQITPNEVVRQVLSGETPKPFDNIVERETNMKLKALKEAAKLGKVEALTDERLKRTIQLNMLRAKNMANMAVLRHNLEARLADIKGAMKDIKTFQSTLIKYAKMALPREERGSVLTILRDTRTEVGLKKAFEVVDAIAENNLRKEVIKQIKDFEVKKDRIYIGNQEKIQEILKDFSFKNMTSSRERRLLDVQAHLWRENLKLSDMPPRIAQGLNQMWATNINALNTSELIELRNEIGKLFDEGLTKLSAKNQIEKLKVDHAKKYIYGNPYSVNLDTAVERPGVVGGKINRLNKYLADIKRLVKSTELSLTYMDRFFNVLDGWFPNYDGPTVKFIKDPIDSAYATKERLIEPILTAFYSLENKLNLKQANYDRIGVHSAREQVNGLEKLLQSGWSIQQINQVVLTPAEMEMYGFLRNTYDRLFEISDKVSRDVDNAALKPVKNYSPMVTDFDNPEVILDKKIEAARASQRVKDTAPGSNISRKANARQVISIDARNLFLNEIRKRTHYIAFEKTMRSVNKLVDDPVFQAKYGSVAKRRTVDYLTLIAKDGTPPNPKDVPILDWLRHRAAPAYLLGSISPWLKQYGAAGTMASKIGGSYMADGMRETMNGKMREFVFKASPEVLQRTKKYNDLFLDEHQLGAIKKYEEIAGWLMRKADSETAIAGWIGAYKYRLKQIGIKFDINKIDEKAAQYADRMVRLTMGSSRYKDLPSALTGNSRSVGKTFFIFASFMLNEFEYYKRDVIIQNLLHAQGDFDYKAIGEGFNRAGAIQMQKGAESNYFAPPRQRAVNYMQLMWGLVWLTAIVGYQTVIDWSRKKVFATDRSKEADFGMIYAQNLAGMVPGVSQAVNSTTMGKVTHPMLDPANEVLRNIKPLLSDNEERRFKATMNEIMAISKIAGVPGASQASQIYKKFNASSAPTGTIAQASSRIERVKRAERPKRATRSRR